MPEAHFPPVYPFLIAISLKISGSVLPLLLLQIILSSLLPILVWHMGAYLSNSEQVRLVAAGLMVFEPLSILWSLLVLTEVVAVFCLLVGVFYFLRTIKDSAWYSAVLAGIFFGLSTLTRPHAQLLAIMGTLLLISYSAYYWMKKNRAVAEKYFVGGLLLALSFFLVISPWVIRNYHAFGVLSVSTTGARNVFTSFAPAVLSIETGKQFDEVRDPLLADFAARHQTTVDDIDTNPTYGDALVKEGLAIIWAHPISALKVSIIAANAFFTQDLYFNYLKHFNLLPRFDIDFSPSVVLIQQGPIVLMRLIWERMGFYAVIPILARLFWILITISALASAALIIWKDSERRQYAVIMLSVILYYAATSNVAGFSDHGRFRYPAYTFLFLFAVSGAYALWKKLSSRNHVNRIEAQY